MDLYEAGGFVTIPANPFKMIIKKLEQFIKNQGWSFYAVTDIGTVKKNLKKHQVVFDEWIKKGYEADMHYLQKMEEDRFNPENKLPDVRSVIVLGALYMQPAISAPKGPLRGNQQSAKGIVASYARGRDYHNILKKKLLELSNHLKTQNSKAETYISVDSGPTVDRVLAECAGIGFFGKNCNIINPSRGSYFFIAILMTNVDLPSTPVLRMPNCADCQKCQKACPTGALVGPGVLDARKCVSYLTIENKDGIPVELRSKIGNRLFGCDSCQECCPFNMRDLRLKIKDLSPECGVGDSLDLKKILSIVSDEEFTKIFAGTPIMRAKRRGLLRNACVVAGNSGDKSLATYLKKLVEREDDDILKEHAQWAIGQLKKN